MLKVHKLLRLERIVLINNHLGAAKKKLFLMAGPLRKKQLFFNLIFQLSKTLNGH